MLYEYIPLKKNRIWDISINVFLYSWLFGHTRPWDSLSIRGLLSPSRSSASWSPTVFNFYTPEYEPDGAVSAVGLSAPEATLAVGPYLIGALDGMSSLVRNGLTSCSAGLGSSLQVRLLEGGCGDGLWV